ncbi:MAG: 9-O-acetylesterase [Lentisphaerae bacterium]|jgi:sialate O-acetylesterase|nr:9-O-acetylesterase [Lentisphaerota bacterium]MBT4822219.1 9-O-acetylesterase [Lentisphaerota bacterium]MBT5604465.1 9-O-acetylesterase [Lentisphaerota bacterium]MBT7060466.1 9-O-acetylesterase [Lentisphaerota bacterium]MBT7844373.1 9-O-acetylesterase [Lentisphaerota bacterium]
MLRVAQRFMLAAAGIGYSFAASGAVTLPSIFGSHMVLQQAESVPIWGWADPGEEVTVSIAGGSHSVTAGEDGDWRLDLPPMNVGTGFTMTVSGANTVTFEDVAVGEVWLCSGQSNMEQGVGVSLNPSAEIAAANHPDIRLIDVPKTLSSTPKRGFSGNWVRCSPETIGTHGTWGGFSAVAYYFGRALHAELGVPIGLIDSSWGGSRIEPWTPPLGFRSVAEVSALSARVEMATPGSPSHLEAMGDFLTRLGAWRDGAREAMLESRAFEPVPAFPAGLIPLDKRGDPCAMYNAMIHPLVPYGIRGAIWYQGESNHHDRMLYVAKTEALVAGWRGLWGKPAMPYYYVQIAPYQYGSENASILAAFWEAQATIEKRVPHTGMAVISDVGNLKDIHPKNKQAVGKRLAGLALSETYGRGGVCRGPLFAGHEVDGAKVIVSFENAAGLRTRDGKASDWFEIGGNNGVFVKADAAITGETVVLSSPEVAIPTAARFAWSKLAEPNLTNGAGLPATAFSVGTIPVRSVVDNCVAEAKDYELVYSVALPRVRYEGDGIVYDEDHAAAFSGAFDRIAYFLILMTKDGTKQFVFASMDAFTDDITKVGVPVFKTKVHLQQEVAGLQVRSNVPGLKAGDNLAGGIEFWPCNYGPSNARKVPGASDSAYDFGDQQNTGVAHGYGSMQIHNRAAKQVVFAYNNWRAQGQADLGIGNSPSGHPDWTFTKSAGSYTAAKLLILVRGNQ